MSADAERTSVRVATRGLVAVIVVLAAIPAYLTLAPGWRPLAARLACALLVAAGCARLIRSVRGSIEDGTATALDAPVERAPAPDLDERFLRLRDELRFSARSRQYFETILRPDLARLGGPHLALSEARRPTLATLERLVAAIEKGA